jgi:hypothetical protein
LIIKGLDKNVCLIIKSLDTQAQNLNKQINQYPKKSLILTLEADRHAIRPHIALSLCSWE